MNGRVRLIAGALSALALVAGCASPAEREGRALRRGNDYLAAGNVDKARIEFRNALQIAPNDAEARYQNGRVLERLGQLREAGQYYQGAIDVAPDHVAARTDLARLYLFGGAPEKAIEIAKPALERRPDDVGLLVVRAGARQRLGDLAGAYEDATRAQRRDPRSEAAVALLAGLNSGDHHPERAREILARGIADIPASIDLRLALAQLELSQDEPAQAERLLKEVLELQPQEGAHRIRLARFYASRGDADAAEKSLREALASLPRDTAIKVALVDFLVAARGRPAAEAELRKFVDAEPERADLRMALAGLYEQGGARAKAAEALGEVIRREGTRPAGLVARTRLAALQAAGDDQAGAEKLLAEVLAVNARDADALTVRGNLRLAKGDAKAAIADFRAVLRDAPGSVPLLRALARAHLKNDEPGLAEETLKRAIEAAPGDAAARLDLAEMFAQSNRWEQAKELLVPLAEEQRRDYMVQANLFRASIAVHDLATAAGTVEAMRGIEPATARTSMYAGLLAEAQNRRDEAVRQFREAISRDATAPEPLRELVRLLTADRHDEAALRLLDELARQSPDYALPLELKGDVLLRQRKFDDAEAGYRAALARAPRWWLPQRGLAYVTVGRGDTAAAIKMLERVADGVDEPARLHADIAQLSELSGRADDAIREYERSLTLAPGVPAVANNLAMLLVTYRSDAPSLKRAADLTNGFAGASNPSLLDTYGWVRLKNGDIASALAALEKAQHASASSPVVLYHLGVAELSAGETSKGTASLRQALATGASFPGAEDAKIVLAKAASVR